MRETVNAADLRIGDIVLVRPGERISADATVLAGGSEVDQATVTGEPLPVDKSIGDQCSPALSTAIMPLRIRSTGSRGTCRRSYCHPG